MNLKGRGPTLSSPPKYIHWKPRKTPHRSRNKSRFCPPSDGFRGRFTAELEGGAPMAPRVFVSGAPHRRQLLHVPGCGATWTEAPLTRGKLRSSLQRNGGICALAEPIPDISHIKSATSSTERVPPFNPPFRPGRRARASRLLSSLFRVRSRLRNRPGYSRSRQKHVMSQDPPVRSSIAISIGESCPSYAFPARSTRGRDTCEAGPPLCSPISIHLVDVIAYHACGTERCR